MGISETLKENNRLQVVVRIVVDFWIPVLGISIAGAECTNRWNHLEPSMQIASPGQLIPLLIGILLDGLLNLF